MELTGYLEELRAQLVAAAAAGGEEAREIADRLAVQLDAAARLVLQDALSEAAQEITRGLAPGAVELRLRGRELTFVVTPGPDPGPADDRRTADLEDAARGSEPGGEGATSRITFRPPDHLKARIEDAAEREGLSVNAFLVRTLTSALDPGRAPASGSDRRGGTRVDGWFR